MIDQVKLLVIKALHEHQRHIHALMKSFLEFLGLVPHSKRLLETVNPREIVRAQDQDPPKQILSQESDANETIWECLSAAKKYAVTLEPIIV